MPRPSTPLLSVDLIVDAALRAVDANGDFTMPGIAAALGVRPSSLYNHVGARSEIVELLRDRAMSAVLVPDETDGDWAHRVAAIARSYRDAYAAHPRLIPLLTTHTVRSRAALAMYETLARAFTAAGLPPQQVLDAITVLDAFVLGSALDLSAPEEVWEAAGDMDPAFAQALDHLDSPDRAHRAFEAGLAALLVGWGA
ncbi:TetR/AcrR family transcriptional regulator C-terminal domain-containing protein [Williamsia sp.]|uniref:TetR/AcrR family transcriptional regulator C-terminal domain-containing protein n=1 Tax=Williamsia sp. TaxID=1872085 RepID=UPI001A356787|nr:TetR/AcrR family transcriptional regulator C-terminal domain-containing protein [Williamsia sp.]MBJ7291306.1 TetR/AcrR family transcriptional regulator C-terminal domain-containing protein [Williamsia sp.]